MLAKTSVLLLGITAAAASAQVPTDSLVLWLDADQTSTFMFDTSTGQPQVRRWANKLNTADAVGQPTVAFQPRWIAGALNGRAVVRFDGSNDALRNINFLATPADQLTVFMVVNPASNTGGYRAFFSAGLSGQNDYQTGINIDQGTSSSTAFSYVNIEGTKRSTLGGLDFMTSSRPFGIPTIIQANYLTSEYGLLVNGVAERTEPTSSPASTVSLSYIRVGYRFYGGADQSFLHGDVAEVLVYTRALTCQEINQVGEYLATRWGLTSGYRPQACFVADLTGDCLVDFNDYLEFLNLYNANDLRVDFNGDTQVDFNDYLEFLNLYNSAC